MQRDKDFEEDFKKAKMVYLVTYDEKGEENAPELIYIYI
jgi:hypothetical protein